MFIGNGRQWYTANGEQRSQGQFVALFADSANKLFGVVRSVRLHQFGHFMMGTMKVGAQKVTLSGAYGGDGLPRDLSNVAEENRSLLHEVPADLAARFWKCDDGWNSAGSIGPDIATWAKTIARKRGSRQRA